MLITLQSTVSFLRLPHGIVAQTCWARTAPDSDPQICQPSRSKQFQGTNDKSPIEAFETQADITLNFRYKQRSKSRTCEWAPRMYSSITVTTKLLALSRRMSIDFPRRGYKPIFSCRTIRDEIPRLSLAITHNQNEVKVNHP